jgi:hypothetical protein
VNCRPRPRRADGGGDVQGMQDVALMELELEFMAVHVHVRRGSRLRSDILTRREGKRSSVSPGGRGHDRRGRGSLQVANFGGEP